MPKQAPLVTAVVLSYRSRAMTARAVASLQQAHARGLLRCIVVDNASGDGTVELLRELHPWVSVIASAENLGFSRGCNLGLAQVATPYVLLLNPDAVLALDDLRVLVDFMARTPRAGMAGPAIHTSHGRLQHAGGAPTPLQILRQACLPRWLPKARAPIEPGGPAFRTDWLCGAVLLLRTAMLQQVGAFDPRFFLYFEETDLCRRALAGGWQLWAVGESVAHHLGGASARATGNPLVHGCVAEHYFRSRFQYFAKHYGRWAACLTEAAELALLAVVSLARAVRGRDISDWRIRIRAPMFGRPVSPAAAAPKR